MSPLPEFSRSTSSFRLLRPATRTAGFTLVEILLAITVFGLVSGIIFGAYTKTLDNVEHTDRSIHGFAQAKSCLERMSADLEAVRITPPGEFKKPETTFSDADPWRFLGEERDGGTGFPKLSFASLAHVDLNGGGRGGTASITYYVTKDYAGRTGYVIRRKDVLQAELFGEKQGADPILCDNVKALKFFYYNEGGEEETSWDSDSESSDYTTPAAVGIVLELVGPNGEDGAPIRFYTRVSLPSRRGKSTEAG